MKKIAVSLLFATLSMSAVAANADTMVKHPDSFAAHKAKVEKTLQHRLACVEKASSPKEMHACWHKHGHWMKKKAMEKPASTMEKPAA